MNGIIQHIRADSIIGCGGTCSIFGSSFIDELKKVCGRLQNKSRLIASNYVDDDPILIVCIFQSQSIANKIRK